MKYKICAVLLVSCLSGIVSFAQSSSLTQQASAQFRTAEKAEATLKEKGEDQRSRSDYLKVIQSYERVYLITPHTGWADNALTSIARLYEDMKDPKDAVKTLQFLLREYPQTPFRDMAQRDVARLSGANEVTSRESNSVENIRFWEENHSIRVAVDVAGSVTFKEGEAKNPDRFFVDIFPARLNSMLTGREWVVDSKILQKIRVAQYDGSTVRIVLDGATMKDATTSNLKDPNRIVMDLANPAPVPNLAPTPATKTTSTTPPPLPFPTPPPPIVPSTVHNEVVPPTPSAPPPAAVTTTPVVVPEANPAGAHSEPNRSVTAAKPTSSGDRSLIRSLGLKLSRVVIDAGHGGHDTGSIGPTGFTEKELVLDLAKRLKALIESEMGAEVVLTRDADTFVALENRTQIANQEKADLFISIHANSSPEKAVRGVETFFLNLNTQSRDALATATRENAASEKKIHELQDILQKIVLNDKADESRELASHIQTAMSTRTNAGVNRGVKQAPFVVLIGATMPSVLAEVSFISNPDEEKRLKTPEYRQQIAESLLQGIKSYAETLSSWKAAN
jgi:N-acetylmuramoyl-L-alanine amidase